MELITIDNVKKPEKVDPKNLVRVIVVIARVHPGESPASFVVQGLIEFLAANNHPISKILRENIVFKIIPMINPDGVFLGNNRCNVVGHDLNRSWNHISPFLHPTLQATLKMLRELSSSECYQIDFVIDIHAHNSLTGAFIYGNTYDDVYRYERHLVFPRLLAAKCHDFAPENMIFNADDRKGGTARRFFCENLPDTVNAYTFNVSMSGYHIKNTKIFTQYTEEGCKFSLSAFNYTLLLTTFNIHRCSIRTKSCTCLFRVLSIYKCSSNPYVKRVDGKSQTL